MHRLTPRSSRPARAAAWLPPALAAALLLGACAGPPGTADRGAAPEIVWDEPARPLVQARPAVRGTPVGKPPLPRRKPAQAPQSAEAKPPVLPDRVIGLTQPETADLLGHPAEQTEKAPARVWHYAGRSCTLDVIFYPEVTSLTYRALSLEVTADRGLSDRACFAEILTARRPDA